jgi:hypothetical protein
MVVQLVAALGPIEIPFPQRVVTMVADERDEQA